MIKLLFVKGKDDRLTAIKDGKFYFPSRNSTISKEGVYNCAIINDKNTYAFVNGSPIKTFMIEQKHVDFIISKYITEIGNINNFDSKLICDFNIKSIGDSIVIFKKRSNIITTIQYIDDNDDFVSIDSYGYNKNAMNLYKNDNFEDIMIDMESMIKSAFKNINCIELDKEDIKLKAIADAICKYHLLDYIYGNDNNINIKIHNNKFINIESLYSRNDKNRCYIFSENYGAINYLDTVLSDDDTIEHIDLKNVEDWISILIQLYHHQMLLKGI